MRMSRRVALKGRTAAVAAIAGGGAVAARLAVDDLSVEAAARTFWEVDARYLAALNNPGLTEDEAIVYFEPWIDARDRLMAIPSSSAKDRAAKVRVARKVWDGCNVKIEDPERLGGMFADIERFGGEVSSWA